MRLYRIFYQVILGPLLVNGAFCAYAQEAANNLFSYYEKAMQAYEAKNYPLDVDHLSKIVGHQTRQPGLLYQMAGAYALNGNNNFPSRHTLFLSFQNLEGLMFYQEK